MNQPQDSAHALAQSAASPAATPPVRVRTAASVIVLRDAPQGPEVLLLRRADRPGDQNSGAAVFPGGLLDAADRGHYARCCGLDDHTASQRLGLPEHGLHHWVAAVRECFEEAGLLFAIDSNGAPVDLRPWPAADLLAMRYALHAGQMGLDEVCARLGVRLALDELAYHSHWVTPLGMPKIFDTRFFIASAPPNQQAVHDETETVELLWLTPAQALERARGLKLLNVTQRTLQHLAGFSSAGQAIDAARAAKAVPMIRPRLAQRNGERVVINPGEPAFAEIGRLDREGQGGSLAALQPGTPVWLSPRVLRLTADNGSLITGPGTNSYFIGAPGRNEWALLDAGPADAVHLQALRDNAPGPVTRLLVTHTHKDHSPAVFALREHFGARTFGRVADHAEWQDPSFVPDHVLADGERLHIGQGTTLQVIHTPGHASNHLCYLLEEEKLLFTGDHLMQGSTVVINPPDGDMAHYLASLERLLEVDLEWLAPGHGFLIDQPHAAIRATLAHRRAREAQVLADVRQHGPDLEAAMVERVYASTDRRLHGVALRSLRAHLLKLQQEGWVGQLADGRWRPRG
ncbi:MAG TPA: MBL fold metallo-hydrolase [Rubrivivax sp.]|nr:MBL fold metallo-hydrolase [Rubrivivax sp.]